MTAVAASAPAAPRVRRARRGTAALPVAAASAPVLALRLALWGGERPLAQALAELALWLAGLVLATRRLEAGLLGELWGYLRPGGERPAWDAPAAARS